MKKKPQIIPGTLSVAEFAWRPGGWWKITGQWQSSPDGIIHNAASGAPVGRVNRTTSVINIRLKK